MTVEVFQPAPIYTVQGVGPYAVDHPFADAALRALILHDDGTVVELAETDFSVSSTDENLSGDIFLAPAVATEHDGRQLLIERRTIDEQGWAGLLGAREKGLEIQLDYIVMALQELREGLNRTVRSAKPMARITPVDGRTLIFDGDNIVLGPSSAEIGEAAQYAERAEIASSAVQSLAPIFTPDDITGATVDVALPSLNVLGYPTSPGAPHPRVRADTAPAHGVYHTDHRGQIWVPSPFNYRLEHFGDVVKAAKYASDLTEVADVSAAVRAAIDVMIEAGGGRLELPAGYFALENGFNLDAEGSYLNICGQGGASRFYLDHGSMTEGWTFYNNNTNGGRTGFVGFDRFRFELAGHLPGTALGYVMAAGGNMAVQTGRLIGVEIVPHAQHLHEGSADVFADFTGNWRFEAFHNRLCGPFGPNVFNGNQYMDDSPIFRADAVIRIDHCYGPNVAFNRFHSAKVAVSNIGTSQEGGRICDNQITEAMIGIDLFRTDPEPKFTFERNHINYRDRAIRLNGALMPTVAENWIWQQNISHHGTGGTPVDIELQNTALASVSRNIHRYNGDTRRIGYWINGANMAVGNAVEDYILDATMAIGLQISTDSDDTKVRVGRVDRGKVTTHIYNSSGSTVFEIETLRPVRSYRSTEQSIPNDAWTPILFGIDERDDLNIHSSGGGLDRFVIPAGEGITLIDVTASVEWQANTTGQRGIWVSINGAAARYAPQQLTPAVPNGIRTASATDIPVQAGDVIRVSVYQDSGAALNALGGNTCVSIRMK